MRLGAVVFVVGGISLLLAALADPSATSAAAHATWPPFVLVAGLLLIGVVAQRDGLFALLGGAAGRSRATPSLILVSLLVVVAAVTTVLNLDTSAAFLTPVLVLAARRRGVAEAPFLYGALLMANSASLLLPGSNLTNLLVLAREHVSGAQFAARMLPGWLASVAVTALFVVFVFRRDLTAAVADDVGAGADVGDVADRRIGADSTQIRRQQVAVQTSAPRRLRAWAVASATAVAAAVALMLTVRDPAPGVVAVGLAVAAAAVARRAATVGEVWQSVEPLSLAGVFGVAVALGALARAWAGPAHLMAHAGVAASAALGAGAAVVVNNLPAAVLLGSQHPAHARALLLGLNLGPNLAVTGSLSSLIWWRAATTVRAVPSARRLTHLGLVLVPVSITIAALALWLVPPGRM